MRIEVDIGIQHHFSTGVYVKQMKLPRDHFAETHEHNYDHLSLLGSGQALVVIDEKETLYEGPCVVEIKAGKKHKIIAITDITWFCMHATDETDPEKVDKVLIKE